MRRRDDRSTPAGAPRIRVAREGGRIELLAGGVVQSIDLDHAAASEYWTAMLPDVRPARALLLGAGGGTLAALLTRRFGPLPIVAVDDDREIVALGRRELHLDLANVAVVLADAFQFAAACPAVFDFIAVDLFRAGERPRAMLGRPFLGDLRRLAPRGTIAVNLFKDRGLERDIARIERVLAISRRVLAGKNMVLHCRAG